jgi:hypothetical protein
MVNRAFAPLNAGPEPCPMGVSLLVGARHARGNSHADSGLRRAG